MAMISKLNAQSVIHCMVSPALPRSIVEKHYSFYFIHVQLFGARLTNDLNLYSFIIVFMSDVINYQAYETFL